MKKFLGVLIILCGVILLILPIILSIILSNYVFLLGSLITGYPGCYLIWFGIRCWDGYNS